MEKIGWIEIKDARTIEKERIDAEYAKTIAQNGGKVCPNIKPETDITVDEARNFWDGLFA